MTAARASRSGGVGGAESAKRRARRKLGGCGPVRAAAVAAAVATLTVVAGSSVAHGQVFLGNQAQNDYGTPQRFAVELRFGPYRPAIDSEFEGTGRAPYREFFGNKRRLMSQIEVDYQLWRGFGSLGVGLGVGYFSASGNNPLADGSGISGDTSTLSLVPLSASLVYRFDYTYLRWRVPLVPYAKTGFDYVIWRVKNGNDEVARDPSGGTGRGGTTGWHVAAGLQLVLDFFDPNSARQFDREVGVNHTYLFVEYGRWDVSGFGSDNKLRLGDTTWLAGLMFEF